MDKCGKCGKPNTDDSLTPEGLCFNCDTETPENVPITDKHVRESMDNIVGGLAHKTGELKKTVRKDWAASNKADRDEGNN